MKKYIEIKNLKKQFGKKEVLKNINIDIFEGDKIALMGSNGAGKTILIEILMKILKPTKGKADILIPFSEVGIQFQDANFPEGVSSKDILKLFNEINDIKISEKDLEKELLFFSMKDFFENDAKSLSGGQKQKLNLLLSMIHDPKLIILDEITTGLDISTKKVIIDYILDKIKDKNKTILLVSHNIEEISKLANRLIYLKDGQILVDKTFEEIEKTEKLKDFVSKLVDK